VASVLTHTRRLLPGWVLRARQPQAMDGGPSELVWTLVLAAAVALVLGFDMLAPNQLGAGSLVVLPLLAASWALGSRALAALVLLAVAVEVLAVALGRLGPLMAGGRLLTVAVVVAAGRSAALNLVAVRRARQREMEVMLRSSQRLGRSTDREDVADEAVRVAARTLVTRGRRSARGAVLLRVAGDDATVLAAHGGATAGIETNQRLPREALPAGVLDSLATGRPQVVMTAELAAPVRDVVSPAGAASWAVAQVQVAGEPFGVLVAALDDAGAVGEDELRLLDGIARVTGLAIGAALEHAELEEVRQRLQHSVEMALEVGRSLEPAQVVDSILVRVTRGLEADQATLARVDGGDLVIEAAHRAGGGRLALDRRRFPRALVDGIPELARALTDGAPVVAGRLMAGPGAEELARALPSGAHTLTLPYTAGDGLAGLLTLGRDGQRPFDEGDVAQLRRMVDVAVLALANALEHARTERAQRAASSASDHLKRAIEAAAEIGSSHELEGVVERALRRAVAVSGAERGSIWALEGSTMVLEHEYDPGRAQLTAGTRWPLESIPLAWEAMRARQPVRGSRSELTSRPEPAPCRDFADWMSRSEVRHMIQCPLLVDRVPVGLLGLSRRRDEPFADADLQALRPFTTLAALLLSNARLLAEAQQAGQAKSAFLNLAVHELRTPLAVIRGYLSLLEDGTYPVPDRTREEAVDTLVAKAQELESLVEVLVMAARLDGGSLPRSAVALDVGLAVREAVERANARARLEGASIEVRVPDRAPVAQADSGHVARILDNLLNNALSYSAAPAQVMVEVRPGRSVEVAVRDRGAGIAPEQHERVFERFHRVDNGVARSAAGLGLGLTISRELARLNGGALVLERSAPGRGSVFVLRLPAAA
jgi:signal transduction histidine kinase